jgi:hypothetical protein
MTTIGGKEFINRGTAENPIFQRVGGGGGGGGGGGANVTTDETPPLSPSGGDLWYDTSVAKLYVYIDGTGWLQANGGSGGGGGGSGGGASVSVGIEAPTSKTEGDLWFSEEVGSLFVYIADTGWVETNPGGGGGGGASAGYGGSSVDAKTEAFFYSDAAYTTPVLVSNATDGARFYNKDNYIIVNLVYAASSNQDSYIDVTYYPPDSETGYVVGGTRKGGGSGHAYNQNITFVMAPESSCFIGNTNFTCYAATVTLLDAGGGGGGGGPRAYVAFDGTAANLTGSIISSYNVDSITDGGEGIYTINLKNELYDGVVLADGYYLWGGPGIAAIPVMDGVDVAGPGKFNGVKLSAYIFGGGVEYEDITNLSLVVY